MSGGEPLADSEWANVDDVSGWLLPAVMVGIIGRLWIIA